DPLVLRLMGLKKLPDVSTISRSLSQMDTQSIGNLRRLSRSFVMNVNYNSREGRIESHKM
ncbi:hypothetical protein, partial [Desulfobacter hydrogenophilus]